MIASGVPVSCEGYKYLVTHHFLESEDFHTLTRIFTNALPMLSLTPSFIQPKQSYSTEDKKYNIGIVLSNDKSLSANYLLFYVLHINLNFINQCFCILLSIEFEYNN